tara:strand:- start:239 stop:706 length:468 start_codon:yes stop_codon:yes gene_type:complete
MTSFFDTRFDCNIIPPERFVYIEREIGFKLPEFYKNLIKNCDRGHPVADAFDYYDEEFGCTMEGCLGVFCPINEDEYSHFLSLYKDPPEFFPEGLVAFGEDGGGNFMCFDYRGGHPNPDPPIVFWRHDSDIGKDVSFIAPTFESFIAMLYKGEDQ